MYYRSVGKVRIKQTEKNTVMEKKYQSTKQKKNYHEKKNTRGRDKKGRKDGASVIYNESNPTALPPATMNEY